MSIKLSDLFGKNFLRSVIGAPELANAALYMESAIKTRTARGVFLNDGYAQSYSPGYAARRAASGRPVNHVDMFFSGDMLDNLKTRTVNDSTGISIQVGYIDGLSENRAVELAGYHNDSGAGINHVKRVFVGLTDAERKRVIAILKGE